jgi:hypothetical protein
VLKPPPVPWNRLAGLAALVAAALIAAAVASSRWFGGDHAGRAHGVGPLGVEECAQGHCASAWWGDVAATPGSWAALGVGVAVTGALAAACAAVTGALALAGRRAPWPPRLPLGLALGFVALTLAFSLTRPRAGLPPAAPATGLVLALAGGGVAAAAALALSFVPRPGAPRRAPHRPEGASR